MENKKPDYTDIDWRPLIAERLKKWDSMKQELEQEGWKKIDLYEGRKMQYEHSNGFRGSLFLRPVHGGDPRGIFLICAGGGFKFKSANEAKPVAEYFFEAGVNVALLDYNVDSTPGSLEFNPDVQLAACEDAHRAIRYLRYHAKELGIRADKIAIGGFSAGGGVSSMAATRFEYGNSGAEDILEQVSSRPDAALLLYGAFDFSDNQQQVLGFDFAKQNQAAKYSSLRNIKPDCPPFFLFQTNADDPRCVLRFGMELANYGIPYEVHTFQEGPHGGALFDGGCEDSPFYPHTARWAELAAEWLASMKFF